MNEPQRSIRIDSESDKYVITTVKAVPPTWRDIWAILRGRYQPQVVKSRRLTVAGVSRELKQAYTSEIRAAMGDTSPFLDHFKHDK